MEYLTLVLPLVGVIVEGIITGVVNPYVKKRAFENKEYGVKKD